MVHSKDIEQALAKVKNQASFLRLLSDTLRWPIDGEAVEDASYEWTEKDLRAAGLERKLVDSRIFQIANLDKNQPWGVFVIEFKNADAFVTERGMTGVLRKILRGLVPSARKDSTQPSWKREHLLFICTHNYEHYRFAYFKAPREGSKTAPLAAFGWGPDIPARTACEFNLPALEWPDDPSDAVAWVSAWAEAFSVEKVTKRFYTDYAREFETLKAKVKGAIGEDQKMYTQTLMNRLMFLRFIERKGWLTPPGAEKSKDYLRLLFEAGGYRGKSFYAGRLRKLFFEALAVEGKQEHEAIGKVPFLNGGLFEESPLDKRVDNIADAAFTPLLGPEGLLYRYNFTVQESTPLDIEVAVDPEMLGKVFEELVTGRHESGSYYTPRPVVSFMCREALKGYLTDTTKLDADAIAAFVDKHDVSGIRVQDAKKIVAALDTVRAVDPACGSGAYLLGLLHEIVDLYRALYSDKLKSDARELHRIKLDIIQNSLYGVDIDPFATNIAMLRLWLSLTVDSDSPEPLPNLDFKIETGDSVSGPNPDTPGNLMLAEPARQLAIIKGKYMRARGEKKASLRRLVLAEQKKVADLQRSVAAATGDIPPNVIDWRVQFCEVFYPGGAPVSTMDGQFAFVNKMKGQQQSFLDPTHNDRAGFDIVLANPPYVRADAGFKHIPQPDRSTARAKWKTYRQQLVKLDLYETLYEKWDLYIPFLERANQLLRRGGTLSFIIPDAYNTSKYADKSRNLFGKRNRIDRIDFCSEIDLFDAGVQNTILHISKVEADVAFRPLRVRRWGKQREEFTDNAEVLPTDVQRTLLGRTFRQDITEAQTLKIRAVALEKICFISVGMVINADEDGHAGEFEAEDLLSTQRDRTHPHRFVLGKDLARWVPRNIRFIEWGTSRSPAHLRRATFPELQSAREKLLAIRTPGSDPRVLYDSDSLFFDASSVAFVPWHLLAGVRNRSLTKAAEYRSENPLGDREAREELSRQYDLRYLLAILNSATAREWLTHCRRSKRHVYPDDWKQLPIPTASAAVRSALGALAQKCLDARGIGCEAWEREIDERVAALYGIELKDIKKEG